MPTRMPKIISHLKPFLRHLRTLHRLRRASKIAPLPSENNAQHKVLILLPETGINAYTKTMVSIASQFRLQGIQLYFARCFHLFERCMFMDSENLKLDASPFDKKKLCTYCYHAFDKNIVQNQFEHIDLRHFLDEGIKQKINKLIEDNDKPFNFAEDEINFSGILEYNLFLYLKKSTIHDLSANEFLLWRQQLASLYTGYHAVKKCVESFGITHILMYDQYSLNVIINLYAKQKGITHTNITIPFHKDVDPTKIRVLAQDGLNQEHYTITQWQHFKELALSELQIKEVVDDLIIKMSKRGIYSYSPSKSQSQDIYESLNLDKHKKTIVAFPSSQDETDSIINARKKKGLPDFIYEDAFADQFEWLDELIRFTENSADFQLVIRLHPRMAPNHREKWGCPVIHDYVEKYNKSYKHVKIIWPQDKISSFDLMEIADIGSVAWSSMGIFMARLGIPVVSGLKMCLPIPNEDFLTFCQNKQDFFARIEGFKAADSIENLTSAFRWYHMMYVCNSIDMSDVIHPSELTLDKLSRNAHLLTSALMQEQNVLDINLQELKKNRTQNTQDIEKKALQAQLYRLIHFFMTNQDDFSIENTASMSTQIRLINNEIIYEIKGQRFQKISPMIAKLVLFAHSLSSPAPTLKSAHLENAVL